MAAWENISTFHFVTEDMEEGLDIRRARLLALPPDKQEHTYDPRDHREPKRVVRPWMAYFNLLRTMSSVGLLGMPVAFSASGYFIGSLFTILIGALIIHTHHLLLRSLTEISRQLKIPYISYRYGFRIALLHGPKIFHRIGHRGPTIVGMLMIFSQLGITSVGVVMTTNCLKDIADLPTLNKAFAILLPINLVLEFLMRTLHFDGYVGAMVNILNLGGLGLIVYHIFKEPQNEGVFFQPDVSGWLYTSGICMFNLSAVGVILSTDKALKNPRIMTKWYGVINVGIGIPTIVSCLFGALGYWAFGTMEENVLRSLPFEDFTALLAIGIYLVSVMASFPLNCYPAIDVIVEMIKYRKNRERIPTEATLNLIQTIARPTFVLISFVIAYYVPHQGPFRAFVAHLCTTMLSVVFPAMMNICIKSGVPNGYGTYYCYLIKDLTIIFIGCLMWIMGIYSCGYLIYIRMLSSYYHKNEAFL